jgi:hypothetical protein
MLLTPTTTVFDVVVAVVVAVVVELGAPGSLFF